MKTTTRFCFILTFFTSIYFAYAQADYQEIDGVVVMEAESLDASNTDWLMENAIAGATSDNYIRYAGTDYLFTTGNSLIEVKIQINTTGKYIFKWRSQVGSGSSTTDANDSWLRFPDASKFYAERTIGTLTRVYPRGRPDNPTDAMLPEGAGSEGWFKVWSSEGVGQWTWWTATNDNSGAHKIFVEFDNPGVYTMEISGRSSGNLLDVMVLSNNSDDFTESVRIAPTGVVLDESSYTLATSTFDLSKSGIDIYPNPSQGILNIKGLKNTTATIEIIDTYGRVLPARVRTTASELLQLDTSSLAAGLYFLRIGSFGQSAFIVNAN